MGRLFRIRKPKKNELRKLHSLLEQEITSKQRRRAEAIILYGGGLNVSEIARLLEVHVNTIYQDMKAFDNYGLEAVEQKQKLGTPARITDQQVSEIVKIAKQSPPEIGLPYGRWSLRKLQEYLIKKKIVKEISYRHLARLLQKGGCIFGELNANSIVTILNATQSSIE